MKRYKDPKLIYDWSTVPVVLDPAYVGRVLGLHPDTVTRKIKSGEFPGFPVGKFYRMNKGDLMALCGVMEVHT